MYGYKNTIRLILIEYLVCMLLHSLYGFLNFGMTVGVNTLVVSCAMIAITAIFILLVKNETVVIIFTFISMIVATTLLGIMVNTLAFSAFIFLAMSAGFTIFMERKYIIYSGVIAVITCSVYMIFFKVHLLKNVASLSIFAIYVVIYLFTLLNLYIIAKYARKYMQGMEEKATEAERANESKMLFLANMSHEIRTPMNAICGMTELALREDSSPALRENLLGIQTSGKVLLSVVNDILDYSKMESGNMEIIPVTYSVKHLFEDVVNMMQIRLTDKEVTLKYNIAPEVPDYLFGDEIRIRQLVFNLLSNSIKYTDKGYIVIDVSGKTENNGFRLVVSVTDSGIGIKKEDFAKLFVSFQQVDTRRARQREGTGLGLAICKQLTNLMDGSITAESTYGVGSKFTFDIFQTIPSKIEDVVYPDKSVVKNDTQVLCPDAKVLVVDDNAVNLKVAQGLLKTFGLTVDTCKSGRECLDILKNCKDYDIIFIDHMMPELDGIDTLNLIRSDSNDYMQTVPLIALTANVMSGIRDMFVEEGFNDYVPKPIDMIWMNSILRKFIPADKQR